MCIGLCTTENSYIPEAGPDNIFERLVDERMDRILYEDDKHLIDSAEQAKLFSDLLPSHQRFCGRASRAGGK